MICRFDRNRLVSHRNRQIKLSGRWGGGRESTDASLLSQYNSTIEVLSSPSLAIPLQIKNIKEKAGNGGGQLLLSMCTLLCTHKLQ